MRPHELQDERSLAIHRVIADRISEDPSLLDRPRARVAEWRTRRHMNPKYVEAWDALLHGPIETLRAVLLDPGERAVALRHVSPFAGIIDTGTRTRIWREVRERLEADAERAASPQ
jgi:hypothetical protein